jgi:hypothetical protein
MSKHDAITAMILSACASSGAATTHRRRRPTPPPGRRHPSAETSRGQASDAQPCAGNRVLASCHSRGAWRRP